MLEATNDISNRMADLTLPVLILHGGADIVTCPKLSAALYENCSSEDKTLRIYPGMYPALYMCSATRSIYLLILMLQAVGMTCLPESLQSKLASFMVI